MRNNATIAAPVLEHHGAPATFFICPGLIEEGAWLWSAEARARMRSLEASAFEELRGALSGDVPRGNTGEQTIDRIAEWMKTLDREEREQTELHIRSVTPAWTPTADERLAHDMMCWADVATLDRELITIGAHTVSHPTLTTLDDDELEFEVAECRTILEEKLGRTVDFFCYPNGIEDDRVHAVAARTYKAAVTVEAGMTEGGVDLHRIPRIGAVSSASRLAWRLNRP